MLFSDILQPTHLLLVLVVALLVLGPKRLPEVSRAIGRSMHDFGRAINADPELPAGERPVDSAPTGAAEPGA